MLRRLVLGLAVVMLALAACNDDTETPDLTDDGEDATDANGATVTAAGSQFEPASIEVPAGTTVTWTNEDSVPHTVTSGERGDPDGVFDEQLPAGGTAEVALDEEGTYAYHCTIHPTMAAEIVVTGPEG